ncbi:hypothetical protein HXX76_003380 [Chlamydomonas incerta]|uniref:Uncharacterized protein n=1 Tax=Chlamydomonas incerta TaxID=51695 RepID=A0A835TDM0_CHLIN|nr:hypothetical protein HXX76_003380 [Chlamydomonas incerta]|eukprot:KAG2441767.1 hypothetical protein HXX76_003380 [Chlamydomonas incerta]
MRCSTSVALRQQPRGAAGLTQPCVAHARVRSSVASRAAPPASTGASAGTSTTSAPAHQQLLAEGGDGRGVSLGPVTAEQLAAHNTLFTSLLKEYAYWVDDEWVTGTIPPELAGTYFRNGPGLQVDYRELGQRVDGSASANASPSHLRPSRTSHTGQHRPLEELLSQAKSLSRLCHQFGGNPTSGGVQSGPHSRTFADGPSAHSSSGASASGTGRAFSRASSSKAGGPAAGPGPSSLGPAVAEPAPPDDATSLIRSTQSRDVSPGTARYLGSPIGAAAGPGRRMSHLGECSGARSAELPVFRRASNGGLKLAAAVAAAAAAGEAAAAAALSPTALSGAASPFSSRARHTSLAQGMGLGSPGGSLGGDSGSGAGSPLGATAGTGLGGSSRKNNVIQWHEHGGGSSRALRGSVPLPPPPPLPPQQISPSLRPVAPFPYSPQWQQPSPALSEPHHLHSPAPAPHPPPPHPPPPRAPSMHQQQHPAPRRASSHHHSMPLAPLSLGAAPSGHRSRGASSFRHHDAQLSAARFDDSDSGGEEEDAAAAGLPSGAGRERTSAGAELRACAGITTTAISSGDSSDSSSGGGGGGGGGAAAAETHTLATATATVLKQSSSHQQLQQLQQQQQQPGSRSTSPHHSGTQAHVSSTRSRNRFTTSDDGRGPATGARPAAGAAGVAATAALAAMAAGLAGVGIDSTTRRLAGGASTGPALRICSLPRHHQGSAQPHTPRHHQHQQLQRQSGGGGGGGSGGGGGGGGLEMFADPHGLLPTVFSETIGAEAAAVAAAGSAQPQQQQPHAHPDHERRTPQHGRTPQPAAIAVRDLQTMSLPQPGMERSSDARSAAGGEPASPGLDRAGSRSRLKALVPSLMRSLMRGAAALVNRKDKSLGGTSSGGGATASDLATVSVGSSRVVPL